MHKRLIPTLGRFRQNFIERIYVEYLKGLKNVETTFDHSGAGVAISYKRSER